MPLCSIAAGMGTAGLRVIGRDPGAAAARSLAGRPANANEPAVWPEIFSRHPPAEAVPADPANSPRRVLFEVFLVMAAAMLAVVAVTVWAPPPS